MLFVLVCAAVGHLLLVGRVDAAPGSLAAALQRASLVAALAAIVFSVTALAGVAAGTGVLVALAPLLVRAGPALAAREVLAATDRMDPWVESLEARWELVQLRERARAAR